jgi:hypothetical protein
MVFALLDSDFGFDGLFGLFIIQPIFAIVLSGLTILVCLIVGLPIRLNNKLNYWWTSNFYIAIIGAACGLTFLLIAFHPNLKETVTADLNGQPTLKQIPNLAFITIGWFLTAFSILHTYPPLRLTNLCENLIINLKNK